MVAVLEKHGRYFAASPFFTRGHRIRLDKPRHAGVGEERQ